MDSQKGSIMARALLSLAALGLVYFAAPAQAAFHTFRIDQVYSNASGTVQYIVMREATGSNGESFWAGNRLETTAADGTKQQFTFQSNLPSSSTASRSVLIGTASFAALNVVTPDYTVPDRFIPIGGGGKLDYASGTDEIALPALPTDGATAIDRFGNHVAATPKNFAGASATLTASAPATPDLNQHGLTGSWFEPATSGQGIEVEFFPNLVAPGTAFVQGAWFTFDVAPAGGANRQRWYTFSGNGISGQASVPFTIFQNVGGNFNAAPTTSASAVGTGTLSFTDCSHGTLTYAFTDGTGRNGSLALTRLLPNITCAVGSAPTTNADFALSGNWFDAATSGQGFVIEVNPASPFFFLTWYTYAPAGQGAGAAGQRWYTGQSAYAPGARMIATTLFETTGGVFDQVTNPAPATAPVGTATVTFGSCASAQVQFNFTGGSSAGKSGTINVARIGPVPPGCASADAQAMPPMMGYPPGGYGPP
jgi:hypothetical protein